MKVFVITDKRGNVEGVMVPGDGIDGFGLDAGPDTRVHELDLDARTFKRQQLLQPESPEARRELFTRLRDAIGPAGRPPATKKATRGGKKG